MRSLEQGRSTGIALWRQIQQVLEAEIANRTWEPGAQLPTEVQLAERFTVNRHTVRRALQGLEEKGLIRVEQGRGTFVHEHVIDYQVGTRTRFTENLTRLDRAPAGTILSSAIEDAPEKVSQALGLAAGAKAVRLTRNGVADGRPISVTDHWFAADRFAAIIDHFAETGSITESLKRLGVEDYTRKSTRVIARLPTGSDAAHLNQPRNRPVLVTEGLNVDGQGRPVELTIARWASDWVQIVFEP